jgi:ergothioneine biosynthesis protein EgtB
MDFADLDAAPHDGPASGGAARVAVGSEAGGAAIGHAERYAAVRAHTEQLAASLTDEDQCVQSMPDASPAKWHRAHTTWFFEQFVLTPHLPGYEPCDPRFAYLFNSYYETVGKRHPRPSRGLLTRPSCAAVARYHAHVDAGMLALLAEKLPFAVAALVELGLQHEQQHQELLATDMLHAFAQSPLAPAMWPGWQDAPGAPGPARMVGFDGGIVPLGSAASDGFAFDNETPQHHALVPPFRLADRLVRNRDFLAFIADGGYRTPTLFMSDGWAAVQAGGWDAPLYWQPDGATWLQMGPGGLAPIEPDAPVRHISWYEADAFARWAGARLPTEAEWETAAADPAVFETTGHVWQWTASPYTPYPGYRAAAGAIGEYNGKFMVNQMVLRGGSLATPPGHARPTYRNFFHPDRRWQFSGLRLAQDA